MRLKKTFTILGIFLAGAALFHLGRISAGTPGAGLGGREAHAEEQHQQYTCGMHPFIIEDKPGDCPICGMKLTPLKKSGASGPKTSGERKIKYWVAPMDPSYIRDKPGKSPMGMDLVPVYEDQAVVGQLITIDPATRQNMGVRTERAQRRDLHRVINTVGLVSYEEPRQYSVNSKIEGWIEKLYVNETGGKVAKGDPMLAIYSPALVAAQEEYLLAVAGLKTLGASPAPDVAAGAKRLVESARKRLAYWDISAAQIKALEKRGSAEKTLTLYAPYNGIVTSKKVREGMFVKTGMELYKIADISRVWIYADIYESELPWVKTGQRAAIELPYHHGAPLTGVIDTIYPYVEAKTRTVKARIAIDNRDEFLKPDMYVNVRIESQPRRGVLAIPAEAVINSGQRRTVFVEREKGRFEPRVIKTGLQGGDGYIEIKQGVLEGEQVVTSAQFMLDSESTLRAAIAKMLDPKKDEGSEADDLFDDGKPAPQDDDPEALF